jgi:hypothetical protein
MEGKFKLKKHKLLQEKLPSNIISITQKRELIKTQKLAEEFKTMHPNLYRAAFAFATTRSKNAYPSEKSMADLYKKLKLSEDFTFQGIKFDNLFFVSASGRIIYIGYNANKDEFYRIR